MDRALKSGTRAYEKTNEPFAWISGWRALLHLQLFRAGEVSGWNDAGNDSGAGPHGSGGQTID